MIGNNGVTVSRTITKHSPSYDDTYGIVYYPSISLPSFSQINQIFQFAEVLFSITISILGAFFIIFFIYSINKYRCPRCKKTYFLKNKIPEICTRCGAKLTIPKIKLPE